MWVLDHKEGWVLKNGCFWTVMLEKTLESPLDCEEIQPVHPKGNQSWIFTGKTDAEAAAPILWPPDKKSQLIGKHPDAGKGLGQEEKGETEDEMIKYHHLLNGHAFEQTLGDSEEQGSLACYTVHGVTKSQTRPSDWTTIRNYLLIKLFQSYLPNSYPSYYFLRGWKLEDSKRFS